MAECLKLKTCPFFGDRMKETKVLADMMKRRYCLGTPAECARHRVSSAGVPVPPDLFPNQRDRSEDLLRNR